MRVNQDGHDVSYLSEASGEGIIRRPDHQAWGDMVVFDNNRYVSRAEEFREAGRKVLGTSRWADMLSSDGVYRNQLTQALGYPLNGISTGSFFYVTAWFNGQRFIASYLSIVYRRFMAGGAGPDLACTGMVGSFRTMTPKVNDLILGPLENALKKVNHRGPIHVQVMTNGPDWCVKDISASFTHPLSLLLLENTYLPTSELLLRLFDETSQPMRLAERWACGLQLSVSPFPHGELTHSRELKIEGLNPENLKHLWLANVSFKDNEYYVQGPGLVGYILGRGINEQEAVRRMYATLANFKIPDLQYRNDVGRGTHVLMANLCESGWLT